MKKIGVTGGIGAGKSMICHIFEILGVPNYAADQRAKWLQKNDNLLKNQIMTLFGEQAYTDTGELNRAFISQIVFNNTDKLAAINALVHPAVAKDFDQWCEKHAQKPFILKEAALLFETASYKSLDAIIVVYASKELRMQRTLERDAQRTMAEVEKIMKQQMEPEKTLQLADFIIYNEANTSVIQQCVALFQRLSTVPR
ncbi:MAG: dephospho-CoA kinase [Marivirga sp.]|jgi:dephospho-CoA kinase